MKVSKPVFNCINNGYTAASRTTVCIAKALDDLQTENPQLYVEVQALLKQAMHVSNELKALVERFGGE